LIKVPYSDHIDWQHPRPWGGGCEGNRSVRIYYGHHAPLVVTCPLLTRSDIAWVLVDDKLDPAEYDWEFIVGSDPWLYPIGWSPSTYSKHLTRVLMENHVEYVYKVQGYTKEVIDIINKGEELVVDSGQAHQLAKHKYL